jgi:hypothetical protein
VPYYKAAKSTVLVSHFAYKPQKSPRSSNPVQLKQMLVQLNDVWTNESKALEYMKYQYNMFLNEAREFGFFDLINTLSFEESTLMQERFGDDRTIAFRRLLKSFYYDHQLMSRSSMDMFAGHLHQFKGDLDSVSEKEIAKLEQTLRRAKKEYSEEEIAKKVYIHRLQTAVSANILDQSKRNSVLTSGFQRPILANKDQPSKKLAEKSNTILLEDPVAFLKILGNLNSGIKQEVFDGALFMHPMGFLKLNNSLGEDSSGFFSKGGAVKDVQIHYDEVTGTISYQKRASFNVFTNEMLLKSPVLQLLFRKMNEAIPFVEPIEHNGFNCNNMHELWMAVGSTTNEYAWEEILELLHARKDKAAGNYSFRNAYAERLTFQSAEKTGNKGINVKESLTDQNIPFIVQEISNKNTGVIVQSDHDVETTGEKSYKSFPTQLAAALSFGGRNHERFNIFKEALGSLSAIGQDIILEEIKNNAIDILEKTVKSPKSKMSSKLRDSLQKVLENNYLNEQQRSIVDQALEELNIFKISDSGELSGSAFVSYGKSLVKLALKHRDSVALNELLENSDNPLDTPQLASLVHSAIMAEIDHKCNKIKVKGAELVLSPSHELVKLYNIPGSNIRVTREEYLRTVELSEISEEQLITNVSDSDLVTLDLFKNGEPVSSTKMLGIEAKYRLKYRAEDESYNIFAALTADTEGNDLGETLRWTRYKDSEGDYLDAQLKDGSFKYPVYNELMELNDKLNDEDLLKTLSAEQALELMSASLQKQDEIDTLLAQEGWSSEAAEVAMPIMQPEAFDLYENEEDNMGNGDGTGKAVSYERGDGTYSNVGYTDIFGITEEGNEYYFKNGEIYTEPIKGGVKLYQSQIDAAQTYFEERIKDNPNKYKLSEFNEIEFSVTLQNIIDLKNELTKSLISNDEPVYTYSVNSKIKAIDKILSLYTAASYDPATTTIDRELIVAYNNNLASLEKEYIKLLAERKIKSFAQVLDVFIGRVPGQSMQSGASARIKSFVFDNRNSIYVPAELLLISGADFDIDKLHTLVFSVDKYGNLYSYKPYLTETGKIDKHKFRNLLEEKTGALVASLELQGFSRGAIKNEVRKMRLKEYAVFQEASKNFILEKMIEMYSDPRNALQANTPMTMDTLKASIELEFMIDTNEDSTLDLVSHSGVLSTSAASILGLEYTNMVGKDGIGIFASGLKGYSAIYDSYLTSLFRGDGKEKYSSELNRIAVNSRDENDKELLELLKTLKPELVDNPNVLVFYKDSGDQIIENISGVTDIETVENKFNHAWRSLSELLSAATDNAKELILARINADATTSGLMAACLIGGVSLDNTLSLFKSDTVQKLLKKYYDVQDMALNPNGTLKSFTSVLKDTWYNQDSPEGFQNLKQKLIESKRQVEFQERNLNLFKPVTASSLLSSINGDITKMVLVADTDFNEILNTNKIEVDLSQDEPIYKEVQKLINEGKILANIYELSQEDIIKTIKIIDSSDTVFFRPNSKNEKTFKLAEAYINYLNVNLGQNKSIVRLPDNSYDWKNMSELNGPRLGILGEYNIGSHQNHFTNTLKSLVDKYVEASTEPDAFDASYMEAEKQINSNLIKAQENLKRNLNFYLNSPVRQLLSFNNLSKELRLITGLLGINGGNPNSEYDSFNFINKLLEDLKVTKEDFEQFIMRASKDGESDEFVQKLIEDYEGRKVGFNPFLVIARNEHYLQQINSLILGRRIAFATSTQSKALEVIADLLPEHKFDKFSYGDLKNIYHGANIHLFLEKEAPEVNVYGRKFKLDTVKGREAFVEAMPEFLQRLEEDPRLENNVFIKRLSKSTVKDNRFNRPSEFVYLKSDNLNRLSETQKAIRRLNLNHLKDMGSETYSNIYDALYLYSLITNKGFRGTDDFGSLFSVNETNHYKKYIKFLSDIKNDETALNRIKNMDSRALALLAVNSIPTRSTLKELYINSEVADLVDYNNMSSKGKFIHSNHYKFPKATLKNKPQVFKSSQTKDIIVWDGSKYLVVTPTSPDKAIPFDLTPGTNILSGSGYDWGKPAIINASNDEGRVLSYNSDKEAYEVKIGANTEYITADVLTSLNPNMIFDGVNFGRLLEADRKKMLNKEVITAKTSILRLNEKEINHLKQKPFYIAIEESTKETTEAYKDVAPGQILKKVIVNGIPCNSVYAGVIKRTDYSVTSNMKNDALKYRLTGKTVKANNRVNSVHAIEIRPIKQTITNVSGIIEEAKFSAAEKVALFDKKKTKFVLRPEFNGQRKPDEKYVSYNGNYYKEVRVGSAVENSIFDADQLSTKVGRYLSQDEIKNSFKEVVSGTNMTLFEIVPVNLVADSTNSYLEYQTLREKEMIQDFGNFKVEINNIGSSEPASIISAKLNRLGVENLNTTLIETNLIDDSITEDIINLVVEDANKLNLPISTSYLKSNIKTIASADKVLFVMPVERNGKISLADNADYKSLITELVNSSQLDKLNNRTFKESFLNAVKEYKNLTEDNIKFIGQLIEEAEKSNKYANNSEINFRLANIKDILNPNKSIDNINKTIPAIDKGTLYPLLQAAKRGGKEVYLFSSNEKSWLKYDRELEDFVYSSIPILSSDNNNAAIIGTNLTSNEGMMALEGVFKKTGDFENKKALADAIDVSLTDVNLSGEELNEELNTPLKVGNSLLGIAANQSFTEEEFAEQDQLSKSNFEKFNSDEIVVSAYPDSTLLIYKKATQEYFAVFSNPALLESYANFKGSQVYPQFNIKVDDKYYVLNNVHKVNIDDFNERDLYINAKNGLNALQAELVAFYNENVYPKYAALVYNNEKSYTKFRDFQDYRTLILYGTSGSIEFTAEEQILFDNLIQASKDFTSKTAELEDRRKVLLKGMDTGAKVPNIRVVSFVPQDEPKAKTIIVSDFEGTNKGLATAVGFNPNKGNSYYLPILSENKAEFSKVPSNLRKIIELAKTNPDSNYYIELPGKYEAELYNNIAGITNEDVWRTISGALYNIATDRDSKISNWPTNLFIAGNSAGNYINSEGKGSISKRKINRTQKYIVVDKPTVGGIQPIDVQYFGGRFKFKDGESVATKIDYAVDSWDISVHLRHWRNWASENPAEFLDLARMIGKRPLLDKKSAEGATSTGLALSKLLNESFYYGNILKGNELLEEEEQVHNPEGSLLNKIKSAGVKISANFESLLQKANVSLGFDLNSSSLDAAYSDEDGNKIFTRNTQRINDLQKAMGSNSLSRKFDSKSKVHLYGSTLYDFIGLNTIKERFEYSVKPVIDSLMNNRNEILVGNSVGLDEVIRNYIEEVAGKFSYVKTKTGYKYINPGEIFDTFNYSFELKGKQLLFSGTEFKRDFNIDIRPEDFVNGFSEAPKHLVENILADLDIVKSDASMFSDNARAELVVEEQFYIQRYIAALSMMEAKIKPNVSNIEEFDIKVEELKNNTSSKFNEIYKSNKEKIYNEDGSLKNISDLGLLAMAKSRNITNDYLKSIFDKPLNEYLKSPFDLLNLDRESFENTKVYKDMLNAISVTNQTAEIINNAKGVTYFDLYNFIKTFSETKIYLKGNILLDSIATEKLLDNKILGIQANNKYIITDSSRYDVLPNRMEQLNSVLADKTNKTVANIVNTLSVSNAKLYNFLLNQKLMSIDPYNGILNFNIGEEIYSEVINPERMEPQESAIILDKAIVKVLTQTFQALSPTLTILESDIRKNLIENRGFIRFIYNFRKPLNDILFTSSEATVDLPNNFFQFKAGNVYNYNGKKAFIISSNDTTYALLNNGEVLRWNNGWELTDKKTNLDNSSYGTVLKLANPQQLGIADALRLSNGSILKASVEVNKEITGDYIATAVTQEGDHEIERKYIWIPNAATWKAINEEDLNSIYNSLGNVNVEEGDKVKSLYVVGGLIANLSNNAEVKSKTTIVDGDTTYKKDKQTGLWKIIYGFKNPKVRFQKGPITISNGLAKNLASKQVSKEVIWELVERLNKNTGGNIKIVSRLDIMNDERFTEEHANAAGFELNGTAYINIDAATLDTPMHELLGHVFLDNLKRSDRLLYDSIIENSLKETAVIEQALIKNPGLKGEELGHEVFSILVGLKTQELAENVNNLSLWDKIMNIVEDFFNNTFKPFFGIPSISKDDSLNTIIQKLGKDALYQKGSIFRDISNNAKEKMKDITDDVITQEEIIERFRNNNYIRTVCL